MTSTEQHIDDLVRDIASYEEALDYHRQQSQKYGRELWQALGIIHDMLQCHPVDDAIGKRARQFLHSHKVN